MSRYIDADKQKNLIDNCADLGGKLGEIITLIKVYAKDMVDATPTADVRENIKGEWLDCEVVHDRKDAKITDWQQARCSICGKWHTTPYMYNWDHFDYCPNCGAQMINDKR